MVQLAQLLKSLYGFPKFVFFLHRILWYLQRCLLSNSVKRTAQPLWFIFNLRRLKNYCWCLQFPLSWQCIKFLVHLWKRDLKTIPQETSCIFQYFWSLPVGGCEKPPRKWPHKWKTQSKAKNLKEVREAEIKSHNLWNKVSVIPYSRFCRARPWLTLQVRPCSRKLAKLLRRRGQP